MGKIVWEVPFVWWANGYKKLLVSSGSKSGVEKIPTQEYYENALEGDMDLEKKS